MTNGIENTILSRNSTETGGARTSVKASDGTDSGSDFFVLVGPTAVGKTAVAIELSRRTGAEIVSADSVQVYRLLNIGTAKPTADERADAVFHMIDIAWPDFRMTVADWKRGAEQAIDQIRIRGKIPLICGGTGLYISALLDDWNLAETPPDAALRAEIKARAVSGGYEKLHAELAVVDPITAGRIHSNDLVRIVRALEVYYATGTPISGRIVRDRDRSKRRAGRIIGLKLPRTELYERIDARVDQMVEAGFESEVRGLIELGCTADHGPMRSIGYKEMYQYIQGQISFTEAVATMKRSTRQYAKRQLTWFNADPTIDWIDVSALSSATVADMIGERLKRDLSGSVPM